MQQGKGFGEVGASCSLEERGLVQVFSMVALGVMSSRGISPGAWVVDPPEPAQDTIPGLLTSISAQLKCGCQIWALDSQCFSPVL